jgi:hypothetical protein
VLDEQLLDLRAPAKGSNQAAAAAVAFVRLGKVLFHWQHMQHNKAHS